MIKCNVKYRHCHRHVRQYCKEYSIKVEYHRGEVCRAYYYRPSIAINPIIGPQSYITALHEIGHIVDSMDCKFLEFARKKELDKETFAWRWALNNSIIPIGSVTKRYIAICLRSYYDHRVALSPVAGRATEMPPDDDIFWEYLNHPKLPIIRPRDWTRKNCRLSSEL